ncbi:hypothetical protein Y032_1384g3857, partial [Ancylostoma ceylanicum]
KSSSSSQKSSKSRRARKEELTREFENCLEQVLTWLLEAEEELSLLDEVDENDLKTVRKQFKDFENFMASLTESQDTVGRVLHRNHCVTFSSFPLASESEFAPGEPRHRWKSAAQVRC